MSIQFTCPHCSQLLSVDRQMSGQAVQCAGCMGGVIVPVPASTPPSHPSAPPFEKAAAEPPVHDVAPRAANGHPQAVWSAHVTVTRSALYSIGALLVAGSIVSFLLGWSMGRTMATPRIHGERPVSQKLFGRVSYTTRRGKTAADSEAIVIVLPTSERPDAKFSPDAVRPDSAPTDPQHPTIVGIKTIGGDIARTNRLGDFSLEIPRAGEYFVLVLSAHMARSANRPPTTKEIVELGQYFKQANLLLGKNDFVWSREIVRAPKRFDFVFPST